MKLNILYLEDNPENARLIEELLEKEGFKCDVRVTPTRKEFEAQLNYAKYEMIFCNKNLRSFSSLSALKLVQKENCSIPFIFISENLEEQTLIESMKQGAADHVLKSEPHRLIAAVYRALREKEEKLISRQAEKRYKMLAESSRDFIFILNKEGHLQYVNRNGARFLGFEPDKILGKHILELFDEPTYRFLWKGIHKVFETGELRVNEITIRRNSRPVMLHTQLIPFDEQGDEIPLVMGIARDITQIKETEEKSRKSAEFLNNIINAIDDSVFVKDEQHRWVVLNESACKILGKKRSDLIGKSDFDVFPKTQAEIYRNIDDQIFKNHQTVSNEDEITWNSKPQTISTKRSFFQDNFTGKKYIVSSMRDLTSHKKMEEKLEWELAISTALNELSQVLLSPAIHLHEVANIVLDYAQMFTGSRHGYVSVINPESKANIRLSTTRMTTAGNSWEPAENWQTSYPNSKGDYPGFWGYCLNRKAPFFTNEPIRHHAWMELPEVHRTISNVLSVPAMIGNELIGQVLVANADRDYTERDVEAVQRFTELYAIAVRNIHAEEALRESEGKYRTLFENMQDVFYRMDADGRIILVSPSVKNVFGYEPEELIGMDVNKKLYANDEDRQRFNREIMTEGNVQGIVAPLLHKNGSIIWVSTNAQVYRDKNGEVAGVEGVTRDITNLKLAENKLRESENLFRIATEAALVGTYILDEQGRLTYVNKAFCEIFGYEPSEIMHQLTAIDLAAPESRSKVKMQVEKRLLGKADSAHYNFTARRKDKKPIQCEVAGRRIEINNKPAILGTLLDVTKRIEAENALKASEKRYRNLVENSVIGVYQTDPEGNILVVNPTLVRMLGFDSAEELMQRNLEKSGFEPEYDRNEFKNRLEKEGRIIGLESIWTRKDGSKLYVSESATVDRNDQGQAISYEGTVEDITERKRVEKALHRRDEILEAVSAAAQLFLKTTDFSEAFPGILERLGKAAESTRVCIFELHHRDNGQIDNSHLLEWTAPGVQQLDHDQMQNIPFTHGPMNRWAEVMLRGEAIIGNVEDFPQSEREILEARPIRSMAIFPIYAGNRFWGHIGFDNCDTLIKWSQSELQALRAAADIIGTAIARKKFENDLHDSREMYRNLIKTSPDSITVTDLEGRILEVSDRTVELYSAENSPPDIIGKNVFEYILQINRLKSSELLKRTIRDGFVRDFEFEFLKQNNETFIGEINTSVLRDKEGEPKAVIANVRDVTERKKLEKQLIQAQKMEAVGRLAGGVAHDFNNILTVINGYSEILMNALGETSGQRKYAEYINQAGMKGGSLIKQLLAFSRRQVIQPQILNANKLITDMSKMLKRLIGEDIELSLNLASRLKNVKMDPGQIDQIIMNLAVNSRDAMPGGGKLSIETEDFKIDESFAKAHVGSKPGDYVKITVTDSGIGMKKEVLSHIFEPFYTTKESGKGTGLGLSTVYGIIKQNQGYIQVYSEKEYGTTFIIFLPVATEEITGPTKIKTARTNLAGNENIYLVEDEELVRELILSSLKQQGYRVLSAAEGGEAVSLFRKEKGKGHLLITDIILPKINGREVAKKFREINPQIEVLFMSGYSGAKVSQHGLIEEEGQYLHKPFSPKKLVEKVREILEKKTGHS